MHELYEGVSVNTMPKSLYWGKLNDLHEATLNDILNLYNISNELEKIINESNELKELKELKNFFWSHCYLSKNLAEDQMSLQIS